MIGVISIGDAVKHRIEEIEAENTADGGRVALRLPAIVGDRAAGASAEGRRECL